MKTRYVVSVINHSQLRIITNIITSHNANRVNPHKSDSQMTPGPTGTDGHQRVCHRHPAVNSHPEPQTNNNNSTQGLVRNNNSPQHKIRNNSHHQHETFPTDHRITLDSSLEFNLHPAAHRIPRHPIKTNQAHFQFQLYLCLSL